MYEELLKQRIIVQLQLLIDKVKESSKDDIDSYSEFMREMILNTYSEN